jgi:hypothetical protein
LLGADPKEDYKGKVAEVSLRRWSQADDQGWRCAPSPARAIGRRRAATSPDLRLKRLQEGLAQRRNAQQWQVTAPRLHGKVMQHLQALGVHSPLRTPSKKENSLIRSTIAALALIAVAGVAHAQMQAPSTPEGRDGRSIPGTTSNPNTSQPKSPMNPSAAEAAAKAELEKKGYTGVKSLTRDTAGNWAAKAMKNNVEIAVILEPNGNVREQ